MIFKIVVKGERQVASENLFLIVHGSQVKITKRKVRKL